MKLNQLLRPLTRRTKRQLMTSARRAVTQAMPFETLEKRQLMSAGLTISLQVASSGGKTANVTSVGQTVNINVIATVTGTQAGANQGFDSVCGSFIGSLTDGTYSVGGDLGNAFPTDEFFANGAQGGNPVDLNGDGYLDAGSNTNSDIAGFFNARAGGIVGNGTISGDSNSFLVGTLTYTVDTLAYGQATDINFRLRNGIPAGAFDAVWQQDGDGENDATGTVIIGAPVVITDTGLTPPQDGSIAGKVTGTSAGASSALSGVTMFLNTNGSSTFAAGDVTVATNSSGQYDFTGLHAGTYYVGEELPAGYKLTTPATQPTKVVLTTSQNLSGQDFIDAATGAISGSITKVLNGASSTFPGVTVFIDTNNSGSLQSGEPSTTTDSNGNYSFTGLAAGTYDIRQVIPAGYSQTSGSSPDAVTISAGGSSTGQNFTDSATLISTASISGTVTQSVNGKTSAEPGVTLYLDLNDTGAIASGDPTVITDASGNYDFTGLQPNTYLLREKVPSGFKQTAPANTPTLLTVSSGQNITGQNFTNTGSAVAATGSIAGTISKVVSGVTSADAGVTVYLDTNDSGALNAGEPSTTTSSTGTFSFTGLAAGTYFLRQVLPSGFSQTTPSTSPTTIALTAGQSATGKNFTDTAATVATASISGTVTKNVSGTTSADSGVTVYLDLKDSGSFVSGDPTSTTSSTGSFSFTNLAAGTYFLRQQVPSGYTQTSPATTPTSITLTAGQTATGQAFIDTASNASIAGTVSKVVSGVTSADAGVIVYLDLTNSGSFISGDPSTTTSSTGAFSFTGLAAGTYFLRQTVPSGFSQTSPASSPTTITLTAGKAATGENFTDTAAAVTSTGSIAGEVYSDANKSGKLDSGEVGIPGVSVYLDINKNGKFDSGDISTTTSSTGTYSFTGLAAGTYSVRETLLSGDSFTSPSSGSLSVVVGNAAKLTGENFGNTGALTLPGLVFNDINGNGKEDGSDAGLGGWVVYCDLNHNGVFVASDNNKTTLSNGTFDFVSLKAGTYTIRVVPKAGYTLTSPSSYTVVLQPGLPVTGIIFAEEPTAKGATGMGSGSTSTGAVTLSGTVFNDLAGTGVQSAGDPGLAGWVVYADLKNTGSFVSSDNNKTTLSDGSFEFVSLTPGTYIIRVVPEAGFTQTLPDDGFYTVTLAAGDPVSIAFGEHAS